MDTTTETVPSIQRGTTFNSPSAPPCQERDPLLNIPSLPRRSPTCPKTLEAVAAGRKRMEDILGQIDLSSLSLSGEPNEDDQKNASSEQPKDSNSKSSTRGSKMTDLPAVSNSVTHRRQTSDSGLGTSISATGPNDRKTVHFAADHEGAAFTQSAFTQSVTSSETEEDLQPLSDAACRHIHTRIVTPILREERLKPFHPLVSSVPARISRKEVRCLRDLEKILLWLAPRYSAPLQLFSRYCEFTIQRIYMTVPFLNERDQHLPTDRPYTNGYFLDLVGQIQQYAAMVSAHRQRARSQSPSSKSGANPPTLEPLTLEGGLAQTGRPATLVSHLDGKPVSLADGTSYDPANIPAMKRTLSSLSNDEGVERSMARRKKNAPPMDINKKCSHCDKVFKRPCDLTKHEKTHSRPWKCSDPDCKYFVVGWPTEKERDRHVNDRHSNTPNIYRCKFSPCSYTSKRESNCKQHMEKAHGWQYVRSKNNGKHVTKLPSPSTSGSSPQQTPPTPAMSTPVSNLTTDIPTPASGQMASPYSNPVSYDPSVYNPSPHYDGPQYQGPQYEEPQYDGFVAMSGGQPFNFAEPPLAPAFDFQLFPETDLDSIGLENLPPTDEFMDFQAALEASDPSGLVAPSADMDLDQFGQDQMSQYCFDSEFYNYQPGNGMPEL
ncbi:Zinc finger transcription factor ace1 [Talaromyces islandicus]|uniref:Zinc finger transcription factor ace1 n=1 Tax=Talaromyces islandicus TaxID=28573 RepID=A0A0U1LY87_TALIS|nr:Zinc finger transcription factor ace1 [Talaromyces islandicus]